MFFPTCCRVFSNAALVRCYGIKTSLETFKEIDLTSSKITLLSQEAIGKAMVPLEASWEQPTEIKLLSAPSSWKVPYDQHPVHYYFGGLPALMQAARKLEALGPNSEEQVLYVNDGLISKTSQSGNQGHVHPSEWSAPECQTWPLIKTLLQGLGVLKEDDPEHLAHYSYLHFPVEWKEILSDLSRIIRVYKGFFSHRLVLDLTTKDGLSDLDRWLCDNIKTSLEYHKKLSDAIEEETGEPTFRQDFRVYWSPSEEGIKGKKKIWDRLSIPCDYMDEGSIVRHTLLKVGSELSVLKIMGDGKFLPDTSSKIIEYLKRRYPEQFVHREAYVEEILLENGPVAVYERGGRVTKVSTLFGSPGHSKVVKFDSVKKEWKPLWEEVPVSAVSSLWKCTIDKEELKGRLGDPNMEDQTLLHHSERIVAAANLSNLHVTPWNAVVNDQMVELIVRITQGANFNATVASKNDLLNMRNNLDRYFIGDWELLSVGTCTRKTWISNVPEYHELSPGSGFLHGLSGIGYSFSAAPMETLKHP